MGSVSVGTVSIFVCLHVGRGCVYSFACMRVERLLVYMGACSSTSIVRSGLRLHLTHHLSRPPPHHHALPVEDAAGALVVSRAGAGCSGERRPTFGGRLAGPGPTGLAGPRLGGGGPLGLRAQGPVCPGVVDCRWSLRACRHGTLGRLHCGCRRSHLRALLCPFLGGGRGCPCGGSPGGPVSWGAPGCLGPGSFPCLLHALRDGAVVPHTHY